MNSLPQSQQPDPPASALRSCGFWASEGWERRHLAAKCCQLSSVVHYCIYGMNFEHIPELGWRYGYGLAVGAIAVVCSGLWLGFKRSGWL